MFVRDFSDLPGGWKVEKLRWGAGHWLGLATILFCLLVTFLAATYAPDGASVMMNATTT